MAGKEAEIKAKDIFLAAKLEWMKEIEQYSAKSSDYFRMKKNAIDNIRVDNIRESKIRQLETEQTEFSRTMSLKKNIVPKLELYRIAYVEFA